MLKQTNKLVDKHFPPGHILHSICNRSTIKVSYRSLPNMRSIISKHNSKIMSTATTRSKPKASCNCHNKQECPVLGQCNQDSVVYQTTVTSASGVETYIIYMLVWQRTLKKDTPSNNKKASLMKGMCLFLNKFLN